MNITSVIKYSFKDTIKDFRFRLLLSIVTCVSFYMLALGLLSIIAGDNTLFIDNSVRCELKNVYYIDTGKQVEFCFGDSFSNGHKTYEFIERINSDSRVKALAGFACQTIYSDEGDYLFDIYCFDDDYFDIFALKKTNGREIDSLSDSEVLIGNRLRKNLTDDNKINILGNVCQVSGYLRRGSSIINYNTTGFERLNLDTAVVVNKRIYKLITGECIDDNSLAQLYFYTEDKGYVSYLNTIIAEEHIKVNSIKSLSDLVQIARINNYENNKETIIYSIITMVVSLIVVFMINLMLIDKNYKKYWILRMNGMTYCEVYGMIILESIINALPAIGISMYIIANDYNQSMETGDDFLIAKQTGIVFLSSILLLAICSMFSSFAVLRYRSSRMNHGG